MGLLSRGEEHKEKHKCDLPNVDKENLSPGAIFECDTCGEFWRYRGRKDITKKVHPDVPPGGRGQQYAGPKVYSPPIWDKLGLFGAFKYVYKKGLHHRAKDPLRDNEAE